MNVYGSLAGPVRYFDFSTNPITNEAAFLKSGPGRRLIDLKSRLACAPFLDLVDATRFLCALRENRTPMQRECCGGPGYLSINMRI